ncbi:hypothetical protein Tco_0895139 [Tanacetum coccineum]|uniref:Uncharacterized protein n=1 Tax=Tanacetum coccineum TaxID=301880 RepID=A0ABQ5CGL6_9ASTR
MGYFQLIRADGSSKRYVVPTGRVIAIVSFTVPAGSLFQRITWLTCSSDDAKRYWLAVKARVGGNKESENEEVVRAMIKSTWLIPSHSAFISAASTNSKWSTTDSKGQPSFVRYTTTSSTANASGNTSKMADMVLSMFRVGTFARECTWKKVDSKTRYSQFKIKELDKLEEPKALVSVDSMLNCDKSSDSESTGFASCASNVNSSSTMTNASSSDDLKNLHKTDDQGPSNDTQSPCFSFEENAYFPASSRNRPTFVPAGRPFPAGSRNRPTSVPAGRPFSVSWHNPAVSPMTRPKKAIIFNSLVACHITKWIWMGEDGKLLLRPQQVVLGKVTGHICIGDPRTMVDLNINSFPNIIHKAAQAPFYLGLPCKKEILADLYQIVALFSPRSSTTLLKDKVVLEFQEAARTLLADSKLPTMFWTEAVSTLACRSFGTFEVKLMKGLSCWYSAHNKPNVPGTQNTNTHAGINQAAGDTDVPSTPPSSVFAPVHTTTPLPPGHSLGSSENST